MMHCRSNIVGSCCIRSNTTANTDATTPNTAGFARCFMDIRLIRTTINADNGLILVSCLAQSTDHGKLTYLMRTFLCLLYTVINLSLLKVKEPSTDSMSMFPELQYPVNTLTVHCFGLNELCSETWVCLSYIQIGDFSFECYHRHNPWNDGFVMVRVV